VSDAAVNLGEMKEPSVRGLAGLSWTLLVALAPGCVSGSSKTSVDLAPPSHTVLTQGNGVLAVVRPDGTGAEVAWGGIHDLHVLPNDNVLVQRGAHEVVELDLATGEVVWSYDASKLGGNTGRAVEVHSFQPLPGDRLMLAESGPARIIEVDRATKEVVHVVQLTVDRPHPHMDTRLARKLPSGDYLVCHEGDGKVREYDGDTGSVVWEFEVPLFGRQPVDGHGPESFGNKVFAAVRLPSGNTLIATGNGHSVLEVTPAHEIVWQVTQHELPGIQLAWVTTLEVLPNGNYVIDNCHAGPGQPLLIELEPRTKRVVWTFDAYDRFGNSVSNSKLLDEPSALR
jgi:outer membrane protein assembly factor BamB